MKKERLIYAVLGILFLSFLVELPPYGIDQPSAIGPFLNDVFPKKSPSHGSWKAVNAFPNLTFTDPVAMEEIPQQNHYYIAGKQGVIWLVEDDENTTEKIVALDIRSEVITSEDAGLINFVLHPEFSEQGSENEGCLFIFYPYHPVVEDGNNARMNRLSKFRTYPGSLEINPASEEILIQDYDPQGWHMGGAMFFDDEGLLYLAFGDGGGSNNEFNSTQQINQRLWAGLVRIDVDNDPTRSHPIRRQPIEFPGKPASFPATFTQGYMIPNDNPWLSEQGAVLEEFYAIGLRSPHRASFDPVEQNIWVGDVGEAKQEEVTILPKGGNAQWPYKEGRDDGPKPTPTTIIGEEVLPTIEYSRTEGISVIGGFVYRGEKWSTYLEGLYIFGDFGTREIWSFNPATSDIILMTSIPEFGVGSKSGISSFATNEAGDIFVLKLYGQNLDGGVVYKLELDEVQLEPIPQLLSETGAFTDLQTLTPAPGLVPYATINPLWSDGAFKKRWIALPNDGTHDSPEEQINFFSNEEWQFPNGTVFVKHFDLPADLRDPNKTQKVETRFFVLDEDGRGYGLTYKWNQEGTEAVLLETEDFQAFEILDEFGVAQEQVWEYPSRRQCMNCHTANSGFVLGVKTWQLNGDIEYPSGIASNQLATWNHLGMFSEDINEATIDNLPRAVPLDSGFSLQERVRSYLDSNCSSCHRPNGVEGVFDARYSTPMANKKMINVLGISHNTPQGGIIVSPGRPANSQLWIRDNSVAENKMPPLAKTIVDDYYIDVLTEWIERLAFDCRGVVLSEFDFSTEPENGFGPVELNQSNGEFGGNDGQTLSIDGETFDTGLGVHAYSRVTYDLEEKYAQFNTYIGVDDESCDLASMQFEVYVDGILEYQSSIMEKGDEAVFVSVNLEGASELALVVHSPTDEVSCDHGNWADARLLLSPDSDGDGVCDDFDLCEGAEDRIDDNNNGIPDACETPTVEAGASIDVAVAPNPFTESIEVTLKSPDPLLQRARLSVYDLNGRLMYQDFDVSFDLPFTLGGDWYPGLYIIDAKAGAYENRVKVIKQE